MRGDGNKIGPAMVLKVMAGDAFNLRVSSWYKLNGSTPNSPSPITTLAQALAGAVAGVSGGKVTEAELTSSGLPGSAATSFLNSQSYNSERPKAFINWIFLDEQFKYYGGGFEQVGTDQEFKVHLYNGVNVNKSGYLYIYTSNETPNIDVFFDNLQVTHVRGPMVEETHYYAFGLPMTQINSTSFIIECNNKNGYSGKEEQDQEFFDKSGLDWLDFGARMFDHQTGRWHVIDPLSEVARRWSSYQYAYNNPLRYIDPDGMEVKDIPGGWEYTGEDAVTMFTLLMSTRKTKNKEDNEIESEVRNLFLLGQHQKGVQKIISSYRELAAISTDFYEFGVEKGRRGFLAQDVSYRTDEGYIKEWAHVIIGQITLDEFALGKRLFGDIVRSIYHELIHVEQFFGLNGTERLGNGENTKAEREFTATFRIIINTTLPPESNFSTILWLKTMLTDEIKDGDKTIGNFYERLPKIKQIQYESDRKLAQALLDILQRFSKN